MLGPPHGKDLTKSKVLDSARNHQAHKIPETRMARAPRKSRSHRRQKLVETSSVMQGMAWEIICSILNGFDDLRATILSYARTLQRLIPQSPKCCTVDHG
jgi:hypothetical protein